MQEAVNSVMLWLTKCQNTLEVCSHLSRQKRLDFKEVDDLRSDQGYPLIFIHGIHGDMCANSGKSCPHVPIDDCVYILSRDLDVGVFHLCLCVYLHKTDIPIHASCVRHKFEYLPAFLIYVC